MHKLFLDIFLSGRRNIPNRCWSLVKSSKVSLITKYNRLAIKNGSSIVSCWLDSYKFQKSHNSKQSKSRSLVLLKFYKRYPRSRVIKKKLKVSTLPMEGKRAKEPKVGKEPSRLHHVSRCQVKTHHNKLLCNSFRRLLVAVPRRLLPRGLVIFLNRRLIRGSWPRRES